MNASTTTRNADTALRNSPSGAQLPLVGRRAFKVLCVCLLLLGLGVIGYLWAAREAPLAELSDFDGQTERDEVKAPARWQPAQTGDEFIAGEGARTGAASEARFRLVGGAALKLKPESVVRFHRGSSNGPLKVDVEMGEVEVQSGTTALSVDSEFGALILDANSAVTLTRQGSSLVVDVEIGGLQMNKRAINAGDKLTFELGGIVVDLPAVEAPSATLEVAPSATAPAGPTPEPGDGVERADLVVGPSASLVVHDPNPPTAIGISTSSVCAGPARLRAGKLVTEGVGQLNLMFSAGKHDYEVSCLDAPDKVVSRGKFSIVRDTGTQRLPMFAPTANIVTDGRLYTVMYQHKLPNVSVSWPTAPGAASYTLDIDGRSVTTKTPNHTLSALSSGRHRVTFNAATSPVRTSRTTTIEVLRDTQAPTGEVASPPVDFAPSDSVVVSGNALPGWTVSVDGQAVNLDGQRTFTTQANGSRTIPIVFTHPTYGTHYYLRRPKLAP